jgi:hypothetical protein
MKCTEELKIRALWKESVAKSLMRKRLFNTKLSRISSFKKTPSLSYDIANLFQIPKITIKKCMVTNVVHIVAIAIEGTVELHVVGAVGREQVVMVKIVAQVTPTFAHNIF